MSLVITIYITRNYKAEYINFGNSLFQNRDYLKSQKGDD